MNGVVVPWQHQLQAGPKRLLALGTPRSGGSNSLRGHRPLGAAVQLLGGAAQEDGATGQLEVELVCTGITLLQPGSAKMLSPLATKQQVNTTVLLHPTTPWQPHNGYLQADLVSERVQGLRHRHWRQVRLPCGQR